MFAAGTAGKTGAEVILLEKTAALGNKILISGKTRCNVTNNSPLEKFLLAYGTNGKWLQNAFAVFFQDELVAFLLKYGVETKVERGGRVFPVSDNADDIVTALKNKLQQGKVKTVKNAAVKRLVFSDGKLQGVETEAGVIEADAVIIATGGATFPQTGSTGDGYKLARTAGHKIVELAASLVPLVVKEKMLAQAMQGVSLKNVRLSAFALESNNIDDAFACDTDTGRGTVKIAKAPLIESRFGEMLFTHFGIGGPIVLMMSQAIIRALKKGSVSIAIDLKPAMSHEKLILRLQRDFDAGGKKIYKNILADLLPAKMIEPFIAITGINAEKKACDISARERNVIATTLKSLHFNIIGSLPMKNAIVTAGGVALNEINPRTMESKIVRGLFFCGEVMDIDADTGGYNLQAAFSTGYIAGLSASQQ